jgi:hypothetical protein
MQIFFLHKSGKISQILPYSLVVNLAIYRIMAGNEWNRFLDSVTID